MQRLFVLIFLLNVSIIVVNSFCSTDENSIAKYEEIKELSKHPEVLLIDVREPKELEETGVIPTSINIPLGSLRDILSSRTNDEEFLKMYGRKFPAADTEIIFTCRSGRRSQEALEIACALGFTNSRNYKGSWLEWGEKEGLKVN